MKYIQKLDDGTYEYGNSNEFGRFVAFGIADSYEEATKISGMTNYGRANGYHPSFHAVNGELYASVDACN